MTADDRSSMAKQGAIAGIGRTKQRAGFTGMDLERHVAQYA